MEEIIFQLITFSGEAKSYMLEGIQDAKAGRIEDAREKVEQAIEQLNKAHRFQTELIQKEAAGEEAIVSLLLIHAQDHLMNAILLKDLANEIIDIHAAIQAK
ncbi:MULTISPECIES: PTS lactose/cellobiose transporter subunit IIA [unclassified Fusibacter]|uniref:PTS lactose/cellobiose transporter subunit IIA n=1 Tax=unclassified Fusibacter TaxID=2624464 RepID=UPI001013B70A|nr:MULTISPECIES: PTS lactose/cellobiose transporter subunit IIA [unclassified Fusibacter]MCK8059379.1 PTS lactose/cellobiose transporter subunit IIA [Fusibacter sp. A2]NPE21157.1 PTS lactose/cellobiose transporter subunit IIA [Fusibacter sp. A1]RXV62425.1 PTS lactose/cellobiose transporter subunit IIA [Fusibacter sp. A1]